MLIHQAPPDRTVHRMVLGVEVVATGVHFGPLLAGVLTASAANLAVLAFLATGMAWTWSPSSAP
ncbi:hypothetical protein MBT84_18315 [Streptomyces sp. MBT84]|uniref:DUF6251 family protein n=1 Tax=Streptomyces sp. MBT84 TaxID=1488414 RepID=UPI001DA89D0F|nr:DUF6251 family protein [Streptomyces sp. MBT84]MBW8701564.1 hypothetical protein [Streptomyces sp. MBT84]